MVSVQVTLLTGPACEERLYSCLQSRDPGIHGPRVAQKARVLFERAIEEQNRKVCKRDSRSPSFLALYSQTQRQIAAQGKPQPAAGSAESAVTAEELHRTTLCFGGGTARSVSRHYRWLWTLAKLLGWANPHHCLISRYSAPTSVSVATQPLVVPVLSVLPSFPKPTVAEF